MLKFHFLCLQYSRLSKQYGMDIYLKKEHLHYTGSVKERGALYLLTCLPQVTPYSVFLFFLSLPNERNNQIISNNQNKSASSIERDHLFWSSSGCVPIGTCTVPCNIGTHTGRVPASATLTILKIQGSNSLLSYAQWVNMFPLCSEICTLLNTVNARVEQSK